MVNRLKRGASLAGMLLGVVMLTGKVAHADEAQIEAGAELYAEFCQNCHGPDRSGLAVFTSDISVLTERLEGFTDEMPDFAGFFEADEIAALYAYLSAPK